MKAYILKRGNSEFNLETELIKYGFSVRIIDDIEHFNSYGLFDAHCIFAPLFLGNKCILPVLRKLSDSLPGTTIFIYHNKNDLCQVDYCIEEESRFVLVDMSSKQTVPSIIADAQIMNDFYTKISSSGLYLESSTILNKKALTYILRNFKRITNNDVYRYVNPPKSEAVFYRDFKKECGITIHKLIYSLRFEYAAYLARKSDLSMGQVADVCGFQYHQFSKLFKKYHNKSFISYRRI